MDYGQAYLGNEGNVFYSRITTFGTEDTGSSSTVNQEEYDLGGGSDGLQNMTASDLFGSESQTRSVPLIGNRVRQPP